VQRFPHNTLTYPGRLEQSTQEHAHILEAIRNRDDVAAERITIEHVRHTRNIRIAMSLEQDHQLTTNHTLTLD
jgi:DNA-binding GntR family transcriptional regulator